MASKFKRKIKNIGYTLIGVGAGVVITIFGPKLIDQYKANKQAEQDIKNQIKNAPSIDSEVYNMDEQKIRTYMENEGIPRHYFNIVANDIKARNPGIKVHANYPSGVGRQDVTNYAIDDRFTDMGGTGLLIKLGDYKPDGKVITQE